MNYQLYVFLIPLLPLTTFVILSLFGKKYFKNASGIIGTASMLVSTILSFFTAFNYFFVTARGNGMYQKIVVLQYPWLQFSPQLSVDMGIVIDPVSVMMLVIVTFVSLMVHAFSLTYMKGETRFSTYFAFLSLFSFSMLALVLSANLLQMYIFWELVGVSSFLLIGFYFERPSAVAASKKAFIVTRFADFGFLIGILIVGFYGNSFDIVTLADRLTSPASSQFIAISTASFLGISALTWGLTLIFVGGAGKSAMFPLHIWLPDAMEGPTPVSALIHAATMVVAGVYLVARLFPIFSIDTAVLNIITFVGASSALIAATIACTQADIKRVLAYSTMSQIGYMMFALGIAKNGEDGNPGYTASMFHLFTHAFFKSLLFLSAGVVIHLVHSNEMKDMGGLRKLLPITHLSFLVGCLAISGIPPFSGFFSKEEILLTAYHSNKLLYVVGLFTSGLTAFYMFRLYFSVFWNKSSSLVAAAGEHAKRNAEGSLAMKLPLVILSICTMAAGLVPFSKLVTASGAPIESDLNLLFSIPPVALSILSILVAARLYKHENGTPAKMASSLGVVYGVISRKFYLDELYVFVTKKIIFNCIGRPAAWIDRNIVDGFVNGLGNVTATTAEGIKRLQSGKVQSYALYFFSGIAGLVILFIYLFR
jgi:NADH-quinone oxidoreductase subunit L